MMQINQPINKKIIIGGVVAVVTACAFMLAYVQWGSRIAVVQGGEPGINELGGFAWSSNIGWISFNCMNTDACFNGNFARYAVRLEANGDLTGDAWSSNIGWIKLNPTGGYPEAPNHGARIDPITGSVTGWMRACAGTINGDCTGADRTDGWDGWIKVTDAKVSADGFIKNSAGTDGGWAWGSEVVGWVRFYDPATRTGVTVPLPSCDFSASPSSITRSQTTTLTWSCNRYVSPNTCSINNGVGNGLAISGSRTVTPSINTTYVLTCQGASGAITRSAEIVVGGSGGGRVIETNPGE